MKLIVEMEMPRFCAECPMCDNVYYGDDVRKSFCIVFDERKEVLTEDRPSWCPIKGVLPDEHGDLVDRDALGLKVQAASISEYGRIMYERMIGENLITSIVLNAPTVIAAEGKDDE